MSAREEGYIRVWIKEDSTNAYAVHRDEWNTLLNAWKGGATFCQVRDIFGDVLVLKLASVVVICQCTPQGMALFEADEKEQKAKEVTE